MEADRPLDRERSQSFMDLTTPIYFDGRISDERIKELTSSLKKPSQEAAKPVDEVRIFLFGNPFIGR
jgi:hypothetical protein